MRITERMKILKEEEIGVILCSGHVLDAIVNRSGKSIDFIFNVAKGQHIPLHLDDNETYEIGDAFGELFDESFRPWIQCAETITIDLLWTLRIGGEHYDR